jgi:DNA-binding NarL/FixJ family response regulator
MEMIKILLVISQQKWLEIFQSFLLINQDIRLIGHAKNGNCAVTLIQTLNPDIVIFDIDMQEKDSIKAVREFHARFPQLPVIVIGLHDDEHTRKLALNAGGFAFVSKYESPTVLINTIRTTAHHIRRFSHNGI